MSHVQQARWILGMTLLTITTNVLSGIDNIAACGWDVVCDKKDPLLNPGHFNPALNKSSRCFCDSDCVRYNDCCLDRAPFPRKVKEPEFTCVPLTLNQSVYAVSNCISNSEWKDYCEKRIYYGQRGYYQQATVYSKITGMHYKNIYCALCDPRVEKAWKGYGPEKYNAIIIPKHSMKCSNNITINMFYKNKLYKKQNLVWKVGNGFCTFAQIWNGNNTRSCTPAVSACPEGTDPDISAKCAAYSLLLSDSDKVYRNPHCALCNGVNKSNMFCRYQHKNIILPSLSEIFSFDWSFDSCNFPENMKWDNFHKRCMSINCPINGACTVTICHDSKCFNPKHTLGRAIDGYLTYACLSVSVVCLLIHVFIPIFYVQPSNLPSKVVNSLAWSLLIAQTLFLSGMYSLLPLPHIICYIVAVTIQFFFLASFFWMNVISIDICFTFSDSSLKNYSTKSYTKYAIYSWLSAGLITGLSITADLTDFVPDAYRPQYTARRNVCWFGNWAGMGLFFYFPILITHILNTVLFVVTVSNFRKIHCTSGKIVKSGVKEYNRLWLYIKLSTMMGTMWAVGTVTSISKRPDYHFPFTVLNGLQGAFLFFMFDMKVDWMFNYLEQVAFNLLRGILNGKNKKAINDG